MSNFNVNKKIYKYYKFIYKLYVIKIQKYFNEKFYYLK